MNPPLRTLTLAALALSAGQILATPAREPDVVLALDPAGAGAEFEGIGAVSAGASSRLLIDYPEPQRSQVLDWLFLPRHGAGFQHLKVEIGGEINSTDGAEPTHARSRAELDQPRREYFERGYEWWLLKEARRRNPRIILDCLAWGAPGWIGDGVYCSPDMADYLVGYLQGMKRYHGLDLDLVGGWNEKEVTPDWIKLLRRRLDAAGLAHVRIVGGDMNGPPEAQWKIAGQAAEDPELARCLHAIGVHYPYGDLPPSVAKVRAAGIRTWSSEHGEWDWMTMLPYLHRRAASINRAFLERGLTKVNFWSAVTSYYDCLPAPRSGVVTANAPWSGAFEVMPTLWAVTHYTQFAEPGWRFLPAAGGMLPRGGSRVAFVSPDGRDFSLVIETNEASADQALRIEAPPAWRGRPLHVWRSDQMEHFIRQPDLAPVDGAWTMTVAPNSIVSLTTTTGQRKGAASSPPPAPFPFPYREDLESCAPGAPPRYLSDQGGAFVVTDRPGGGRMLSQQVQRAGIDWSKSALAYTVAGDPNWNDVDVSAEARLENGEGAKDDDHVGLLARWYPGATWIHFTTPHPAGYHLRLRRDGRWTLTAARAVLAEGAVAAPGDGWHQLRLTCRGDEVRAWIDGRPVAEMRDATYPRGLAGLTSGFHPADFDELSVTAP